jgi:FKBP-type peptidyl-prolyl cis-trans isomerase 2
VVTALSETTATLDGNHPLAGEALNFDLELVEIV